jgi:SHS family lactate transporter-like MFS transporter
MCIFMGCVYVYVIVMTFVGPEYLRRSFEVNQDSDLNEAAGHDTIEKAMRKIHQREAGAHQQQHSDPEDIQTSEKGVVQQQA